MKLLTWRDLAERSSASISTLKRLHQTDPDFPKKVRISPGRVGFFEDEAEQWLSSLREREAVDAILR